MLQIIFILLCFINFGFTFSKHDSVEDKFTNIYNKNGWGKQNKSGGGSLIENCLPYVQFLERFIKENNITSVLDLGCGDFSYAKHIDWAGIQYLGIDVVKQNVINNTEKYGNENIHFVHGNILNIELPGADLVICKHVLQHLPNTDVLKFLPKLKDYQYCIITDQIQSASKTNKTIPVGGSRSLNLLISPFNVKAEKVLEFKIGKYKHQSILIHSED